MGFTQRRKDAKKLALAALALLVACDSDQGNPAVEFRKLPGLENYAMIASAALPADQWRALAKEKCSALSHCSVFGWTDASEAASGMPLTDREVATRVFSLDINRSTGFDRALWNCKVYPRSNADDCLDTFEEDSNPVVGEKLPEGAPEAPVTGMCANPTCESNKLRFTQRDWSGAWRGDYQAQRNVAFCRSTGCDGAVQLNKIEGCAWRMVIARTQTAKSDDTDASNLRNECGKLDQTAQDMAKGKVAEILVVLRP